MKKPQRYYLKPEVMTNMLESNKSFDMSPVEAIQMTGFGPTDIDIYRWVETYIEAFGPHTKFIPKNGISVDPKTGFMILATSKGLVSIEPGDWIVRNAKGKFSKCENNEFEATYDVA